MEVIIIFIRFGKSKRNGVIEKNITTPGPGYYEQKKINLNTPKYSMGLKLDADSNKLMNSPGPGKYDPNFEINCRKPSAFSMAHRPRSASRENLKLPGPGEYEIKGSTDKPSYK
jgi:hypothetical protein